MNNPLDVINAQGAQVEQLKRQLREQQIVITLLASEFPGAEAKRYDHKAQAKAEDNIEEVTWNQNKDGTIVVRIKHYKKGK